MRNGSGYCDPTAGKAIGQKTQSRPLLVVSKPVPANNKVYFKEDIGIDTRIYDVFMHYKGYHNIEMGEWVSVRASTRLDAESKAKTVPVKKPAEILLVKIRKYNTGIA